MTPQQLYLHNWESIPVCQGSNCTRVMGFAFDNYCCHTRNKFFSLPTTRKKCEKHSRFSATLFLLRVLKEK